MVLSVDLVHGTTARQVRRPTGVRATTLSARRRRDPHPLLVLVATVLSLLPTRAARLDHSQNRVTPARRRLGRGNSANGLLDRSFALVLVLCVAGGVLVVALHPFGSLASPASAPEVAGVSVRPIHGAVAPVVRTPEVPPTLVPAPALHTAPVAQAVPTVAPTSAAAPGRMQVRGTDGQGVVLHSAPDAAAREPAGFLEGASVTVLAQQGAWTQVRGANGREGWVEAQYLTPAP